MADFVYHKSDFTGIRRLRYFNNHFCETNKGTIHLRTQKFPKIRKSRLIQSRDSRDCFESSPVSVRSILTGAKTANAPK